MSSRTPDIRPATLEVVARPDARRRSGHRREPGERRARRSARTRMEGALVDISVHGTVAYKDVVAAHFDGHPYAARHVIDKLIAAGHIEERFAAAPEGGSFRALTATAEGARKAGVAASRHGLDTSQRFGAGRGRPRDAAHDVAIYRAVLGVREELAAQGATVRRIRLEGELRGIVARRSEAARARTGKAAADTARRRAAAEHQLPIGPDGKVAFPDAQVEYTRTDEDGRDTFGRVNVEVISEHYRGGTVSAKAAAGFALFGASGRAAANIVQFAVRAGKAATGPDTNARGGSNRPPSDLFEI